jgi:hypothetical protein
VTIVEFGDLQCPACKAAQPTIEALVAAEPQARFVFQNFPLEMHNWAAKGAAYADCVGRASNDAFWNPPPADPGSPAQLFDGTIYERGEMTLEALRERIGNSDFYAVLRQWASDHRHANATTQDFIDLAESVSGQDLTQLFQDWLYTPGKPAGYKQASVRVTADSQGIKCAGLGLAQRSWNPCAQTQSPSPVGRR